MRIVVFESLQADKFDELLGTVLAVSVVEALAFQTEDHVLENRAPRHQAGILEDHAAVRAGTADLLAVDHDFSSGRFEQAVA